MNYHQAARIRSGTSSCDLLINVMKAAEHRYRDDLSSLSASMRRACYPRAGRPLSHRPMRAPVVEIADILGQDLLQMALVEYQNVVQALGPDRSHPALGDGVERRSEWRANLRNTNITHATIESGAITAVAVMNEETSRYSVPRAAFDNLLRRPRSGRMRRHANVDDLSAGMFDHEQHEKHSDRDRSASEEVARPVLRPVLPQE